MPGNHQFGMSFASGLWPSRLQSWLRSLFAVSKRASSARRAAPPRPARRKTGLANRNSIRKCLDPQTTHKIRKNFRHFLWAAICAPILTHISKHILKVQVHTHTHTHTHKRFCDSKLNQDLLCSTSHTNKIIFRPETGKESWLWGCLC